MAGRRNKPSWATIAVLAVMLEDPTGVHYGLELARRAGIPAGTVYPLLSRLENDRWVDSSWEEVEASEVGRPRRRIYSLTGHGARAARESIEAVRKSLPKALIPHPSLPDPGAASS